MKHILLPLSIFLCYQLQAQKVFTVRIEGIHPSVEAQLATGEYLVNAAGVNDGAAPYNLFIDVNSIGATSGKRIFKYVDLKANAARQYAMKVAVDVEKSSKFDATYDLIVLVRIPTTFDNSVWGTAVRKPDQGEIIMTLDRYSRTEGKSDAPNKHLVVEFSSPAINGELMSTVKATGDNVAGMDRERFTVLMKNSGAFDWAYSRTGLSGKLENRTHITAVLDDLRGVDLSKPVDLRLAMATDQNNFLWKDITLQPQQFGVNIVMDSYSGMPGDPKAALRTVDDPLPVLGSGSGSSVWNGAPPPVPDAPAIGTTPKQVTMSPVVLGEPGLTPAPVPPAPAAPAPITSATILVQVDPSTEDRLVKGDRISCYDGVLGERHRNLTLRIHQGGTLVLSKQYTFIPSMGQLTIPVANSDKLDLNNESVVTVGVETIYGNSIWGSENRRGSALNEPILMDEYSAGIDSRAAPGNVLVIDFEAKPQDKDMKRELKDKDIDLKDLTNSAFRIQMKNEESAGWLVDTKGPEGRCKGGSIQALFPEGGGLDLEKPVVVRASARTPDGRFLWQEATVEPQALRVEFRADRFTDELP